MRRERQIEQEIDFLEDPENFDKQYHGRLSPWAKERLYLEYYKGTSIHDLSLKYGILHQRVKAIIFQKFLYWHEVYPKMGETHMRLAIEREVLYASEYPFMDYGCDLSIMAELEKGFHSERLTEQNYDANPPKEEKEYVDKHIMKYRPRYLDRVPVKLIGRGGDAYLLQEMVIHKGKGAPRVSEKFR